LLCSIFVPEGHGGRASMSTSPAGGEAIVAEMIQRLGPSDRLQRVHAGADLVRLGKQDKDLAGPLTAALGGGQGLLRKMAALVLGDLAPRCAEAIPALIDALRDEDEGLRRRAVVALGQFGPRAAAAVGPLP